MINIAHYIVLILVCICLKNATSQICKLPKKDPWAAVSAGFPRNSDRVKTIGTVNITVLFVDFSDVPASQTPQQVYDLMSPTTAVNFFKSQSYGKLTLRFIPSLKWIRMSKPSIQYGMSQSISYISHKLFLSEAVNLTSNVDFSSSDEIVVLVNPSATNIAYGPAFTAGGIWGFTAKGKYFLNAITSGVDLKSWGSFWFTHEMGHSLGLPDLYAFGSAQLFQYVGDWYFSI
jgi:M6 family metalloprotease-like protein